MTVVVHLQETLPGKLGSPGLGGEWGGREITAAMAVGKAMGSAELHLVHQ